MDAPLAQFEESLKRIRAAAQKVGIQLNRVITSQDDQAVEAQKLLIVTGLPRGFTEWQLPVWLDRPSELFITLAAPNTAVPEHSHDAGDGIRFIAGGSIIYDGRELTAGDWLYIPAGVKYSFKVGPLGATMCYCYCCCAGPAHLASGVVNPRVTAGA